jgi:acyl carrier protein
VSSGTEPRETAEAIRRFLADDMGVSVDGHAPADDFPLIDGHAIDSIMLYELVTFLEDQYAITIDDEELLPEHFGTIADISRLIAAKRQ